MSTSAQLSPAWKQEVNRRIAEHRGRKGSVAQAAAPAEAQYSASRRAAEAAARVAARYANAPSYSEVLAQEARAALRAAEAASRAALHAQAAAKSVLAGLEAANAAESEMAPTPLAAPVAESPVEQLVLAAPQLAAAPAVEVKEIPVTASAPAASAPAVGEPLSIRWDAGLPARLAEPVELRAARGQDLFETGAEDWWRPAAAEAEQLEPEPIELVEPVAIPANLIEFPRELVATRKARPRLAEACASAPEAGTQLSIFEVDPVSLAHDPDMEVEAAAQNWSTPTWSGIELEETPAVEIAEALAEAVPQVADLPAIEPAPATQRLMALVVDSALVAGSVLGAAMMAATKAHTLPGPRTTEILMAVALMVAAGLYQVVFLTLGRSTPGMRYARVRLNTFEGLMPSRGQRWKRMAAQLVSVLPVGFGLAWALFDDNHLSWHDRLSHTYLCKR